MAAFVLTIPFDGGPESPCVKYISFPVQLACIMSEISLRHPDRPTINTRAGCGPGRLSRIGSVSPWPLSSCPENSRVVLYPSITVLTGSDTMTTEKYDYTDSTGYKRIVRIVGTKAAITSRGSS